jgi:hypothetical protein
MMSLKASLICLFLLNSVTHSAFFQTPFSAAPFVMFPEQEQRICQAQGLYIYQLVVRA